MVLGPEVEAWYRKSRTRLNDGYCEENWFVTPTHIVVSKATPDRLNFTSFARNKILEIEHSHDIIDQFGVEVILRRVTVKLSEQRTLDIPVPDEEQREEYWEGYRAFIERLRDIAPLES